MKVFVLDKNQKPLMPTSPTKARKLLKAGRAVVVKRQPFIIRLKDRVVEQSQTQPVRLKFDPGAKVTGIALVREINNIGEIIHLAELHHRGQNIKSKMDDRRAFRRRRRTANLHYRPPRFNNRTKPKGWLPPSLQSRVDNIASWTEKYKRLVPITAISVETVRFDTQKLQNPEISGVEYQQGELAGYEVREYLLEKWGRKCVYCDKENVPLEVEHIRPRSRGGSNRVSNLTLSCEPCNVKKGNRPIEEFLAHDPARLKRILAQTKKPLQSAAIVNATRWAAWNTLNENGLAVEMGTGGRTKYNRMRLGIPKTHALDAVCVGASTPDELIGIDQDVLAIRAVGRGKYQRKNSDKFGFPKGVHKKGRQPQWRKPDGSPKGHSPRKKHVNGIKTGDTVRANILTGQHAGRYVGQCVIRHTGNFKVKQNGKVVAEGHYKYFELVERASGYEIEANSQ